MTRFPASGGGSGPPYTYVMDGYPDDAEEGESLYHITEDAAYVYTGSAWVEQTVTNHGQLAGISAADHHRPVPSGAIVMWSGSTNDVPAGYTLCDGTDDTPDLTDRFIVGAGSSYATAETGGEASVQLTEAEMPSHSHPQTVYDNYDSYAALGGGYENGNATQRNTGDAGGDEAHENRPPYYALAFIMKT